MELNYGVHAGAVKFSGKSYITTFFAFLLPLEHRFAIQFFPL